MSRISRKSYTFATGNRYQEGIIQNKQQYKRNKYIK